MQATIELLTRLIRMREPDEETDAALRFLTLPDLAKIAPSDDRLRFSPAGEWLRIYQIKQESTDKTGVATGGFPSLLAALRRLPPSEPITLTAFQSSGWHGAFWLNQTNELIGFVLVARRTPAEERERLDWFLRHFT
jgi:hypothetical protein